MNAKTAHWQLNDLDKQLINMAFAEDFGLPYCDITTKLLFPGSSAMTTARIISKHPEPIILCGIPIVKAIMTQLGGDACSIQSTYEEGQVIAPGATLMEMTGPASVLLMAERTMLNFLQRLCAIATMTHQYVSRVKQTNVKILDTRKTLPGFRHLEKYAVHCGGGVNHRMGLYDAIMIKDTHIDALGGMKKTLAALEDNIIDCYPVIVEVRTYDELTIVLENSMRKVSRVLLDNMSPSLMSECVAVCRGKLPTEASGNISFDTILDVAQSGVDFISVGKITHSAGSVDLSMKCER